MSEVPAETDLSIKLSKDLKKLGFKFVGPKIMYSFLQSIGIIDDHLITCPYHSYNRKRAETMFKPCPSLFMLFQNYASLSLLRFV